MLLYNHSDNICGKLKGKKTVKSTPSFYLHINIPTNKLSSAFLYFGDIQTGGFSPFIIPTKRDGRVGLTAEISMCGPEKPGGDLADRYETDPIWYGTYSANT